MASSQENLAPATMGRLVKEVKNLAESPAEGITVHVNDSDLTDIQADIEGPAGTPYAGGTFRMRLVFGGEYPNVPPKGYFVTKVFHPNISKSGEICVNTLKRDWKPDLGLRHILMVIRCLLIEPFPESALNEEAGKLLMEDYESYASHARMMTSIHAIKQTAAAGGADGGDAAAGSGDNDAVAPKKVKTKETQKLEKKRSLKRL